MVLSSSPEGRLPAEHRRCLLGLARASIMHGLRHGRALRVQDADFPADLWLVRATFVTLEKEGELRGCIGALRAVRPLVEDVSHNAYAAANHDPRFARVCEEEAERLAIGISILGEPEPFDFSDEEELIAKLRPGIDGLILADRGRLGTFLPSVWDMLPDPRDFWRHLKHKAGLPADHWSESLEVKRYTTESFGEE